jgi:hypothetical protein
MIIHGHAFFVKALAAMISSVYVKLGYKPTGLMGNKYVKGNKSITFILSNCKNKYQLEILRS